MCKHSRYMIICQARFQYIPMQVGDATYTETGNSLSDGGAAAMVDEI